MKPGLKNPLMRITNLLLYLSFCGLVGTGSLMTWRLIPGSEGGHGLSVLGWGRHDWGGVHFWLGVICVISLVVHLLLNWAWLKKIAAAARPWRLWLGLGVGLAIILIFMVLPVTQVEGGRGGDGFGQNRIEMKQGQRSFK